MELSEPSRNFDYDAGVKLLASRKFQLALSEFRGVVAETPDHAFAHFQSGRILLEAFQASDAIQWLTKAVSLKPDEAKFWQAWAEAVALGGDDEDRAKLLSDLKEAPIDAGLRLQLQDRFGARRKASRPATGGVPKSVIKALAEGLRKGDFAKIGARSAKLLNSHPKSAVSAFILAEAQSKLGLLGDAFTNYQKAVKLDPLYAEAYGATGQLLLSKGQPQKAQSAFRPAVILTPDSIAALVGMVQSLTQTGNHKPTVVLLERLTRLEPKNGLFWTGLGDAWRKLGEHPKAIQSYRTALAQYSEADAPSGLRLALADVLSGSQQDDEALAQVETVLAREPESPDALISHATILQMGGEFEAADQVFRKAVAIVPENGEAYRRLVAGYKVKPDDPMIDTMARQFERTDLQERDRMNLGFALGKAAEDAGLDDQVFKYLNEANRIAAKLSKVSEQQLFSEIVESRDVFGKISFQDVAPVLDNDFAPVFVTGLPRSGTTLVEQIIAAHSSMTSGGELGIAKPLCNEMRNAHPGSAKAADSKDALSDVARKYTDAMAERLPGAERVTDKSIYTFLALGPLKLALPKARFVVVRRDPRDNLFSIYKNKFPDGSHGYANDFESLARYYDEFDKMIAFWRDKIPDWFYEVQYEALVSDPETEARKLIAACGLEWEDDCLNFHKKKSKVQTLSVYQVRQPISKGSVSGWRRFEADLVPMIDQLRKDGHVTD